MTGVVSELARCEGDEGVETGFEGVGGSLFSNLALEFVLELLVGGVTPLADNIVDGVAFGLRHERTSKKSTPSIEVLTIEKTDTLGCLGTARNIIIVAIGRMGVGLGTETSAAREFVFDVKVANE